MEAQITWLLTLQIISQSLQVVHCTRKQFLCLYDYLSAGIEEVNFDLYPDEAFQKRWLQTYLQERARLIGRS